MSVYAFHATWLPIMTNWGTDMMLWHHTSRDCDFTQWCHTIRWHCMPTQDIFFIGHHIWNIVVIKELFLCFQKLVNGELHTFYCGRFPTPFLFSKKKHWEDCISQLKSPKNLIIFMVHRHPSPKSPFQMAKFRRPCVFTVNHVDLWCTAFWPHNFKIFKIFFYLI